MRFCLHANQFIFDHVNGAPGLTMIERLTTVFVDRRLWKTKHAQKSFQNFSQSCVLSTDRIEIHQSQSVVWPSDILYVMLEGCDWWISIRSVDNRYDWRKLWKRFCGCFVFKSCVSTKTVVKQVRNGLLSNLAFPSIFSINLFSISLQRLPFPNFFPQNTKMCFASERCWSFYCASNFHVHFGLNQTRSYHYWSFSHEICHWYSNISDWV